ncbi:ATP-binding protein [Microbacterium lacus]|uniref:ATP-binding protein n=1 Tax=Microbacterium lacus TaxID=415217 RepID=UPI00384F413A
MTTASDAATLEDAWGHIAPTRGATGAAGSFTRIRIERIFMLIAALSSLVLGIQAVFAILGSTEEQAAWRDPLVTVVFVSLGAMILACVLGRGVRLAAGAFAVIFVLALAIWPIATAGSQPQATDLPWIWYLVNIATLAAVLAFPLPLQIVWTVLAPVMFGVVRLVQGGFTPGFWLAVGLDVSFTLIIGGIVLTLAWVFRAVAANVDETRARAVHSYARAAAADAAEQERVAVAALMHDSVLAALIAAERAESPRAQMLATAMAREALTRLANTEQGAEEGSDAPREPRTIADDIEAAAAELGVVIEVERDVRGVAPLPGRVARALALAATQAVANALQHAEGSELSVRVTATGVWVRIDVIDNGSGFAVDDVAEDRLGIRASIVARVAAVGGTTAITSSDAGTSVRLTWLRGAA